MTIKQATAYFTAARSSLVLAALLACLLLVQARQVAAQQVSEYHIKAVFLINLTHFVTWPPAATRAGLPFVIGIYGPDPFGDIIDKAVAGEKKSNRALRIERYTDPAALADLDCQILFIHQSRMAEWETLRNRLAGLPVLTVADAAGFPEQGGMVNLLKNEQKIQVEINHRVVQQAGLSMSSKLLSLARIVE